MPRRSIYTGFSLDKAAFHNHARVPAAVAASLHACAVTHANPVCHGCPLDILGNQMMHTLSRRDYTQSPARECDLRYSRTSNAAPNTRCATALDACDVNRRPTGWCTPDDRVGLWCLKRVHPCQQCAPTIYSNVLALVGIPDGTACLPPAGDSSLFGEAERVNSATKVSKATGLTASTVCLVVEGLKLFDQGA